MKLSVRLDAPQYFPCTYVHRTSPPASGGQHLADGSRPIQILRGEEEHGEPDLHQGHEPAEIFAERLHLRLHVRVLELDVLGEAPGLDGSQWRQSALGIRGTRTHLL